MAEAGWVERLEASAGLALSEPLGCLDFAALMSRARLLLTDSGGVQEKTTVLAVQCLTMRTTTERWVTGTERTSRLVHLQDGAAVLAAVGDTFAAPMPETARRPPLWDGHVAEWIVTGIAVCARQLDCF